MRVILFLIAVLAGLAGLVVFSLSKGAVHEIQGLVLWLIAAVALVGASVVDAIISAADTIVKAAPVDRSAVGVGSSGAPASGDDNAASGKLGICPNCELRLPVEATECRRCKAQFGPGSSWKIKPLD